MKKALFMLSVTLFTRMLAAQEIDLASLQGERWYGLYLNGHKSGYSMTALSIAGDGAVTYTEDCRFQVTMGGQRQDMRSLTTRSYASNGALLKVEAQVDDASGRSLFSGKVEGDALRFTTKVGGTAHTEMLPRPSETLTDMARQLRLLGGQAKIGDKISYRAFEPAYRKEFDGHSAIETIEERNLEGVATKVFKIRSAVPELGVETVSIVTEKGLVLEDTVAGIMVMRLEPKEMAQDVQYSNDVLVSNAALLDAPIEKPGNLIELALTLRGPLSERHSFHDSRQALVTPADGGPFSFSSRRLAADAIAPLTLPLADIPEDVLPWTKPSTFVQSDNAKIVAKAREIAGDEKDAFAVASKLCTWTCANVRSTFSARLSNALEVLENPEGDCTEHSVLFVGLARAAGIPAREVAGLVYTEAPRPGFYFHQWAKVWIGTWVDMDPTFGQPLVDPTHIKLSEGDLLQQTQLISIIGQVRVEVVHKKYDTPGTADPEK